MKRRAIILVVLALSAISILAAQAKKPATFPDFGRWEILAGRQAFSPDGKWLACSVNRANGQNELRIVRIAGGEPKVVAFGTQPTFSDDSRWVAYAIGMSESDQEKLRKDKKPVQNKIGLVNLGTGEAVTVDAVESFTFSPDGACLAMRKYAPKPAEPAGGAGGGDRSGRTDEDEAPGTTLIVRQLANGRDTTFGNISESVWEDADGSCLLAMTVSMEGKTGNGVQLFYPRTGVLRTLDSSAATYTGLAWRKDAADLAVLRSKADEKKDGPAQVVLAWRALGSKLEKQSRYDQSADSSFLAGLRVVSYRRPAWASTGDVIFVGLAKWSDKPVKPAADGKSTAKDANPAASEKPGAPAPDAKAAPAAAADEASTVEVWHAKDVFVMPLQKNRASSDRKRNMVAAWRLDTGKLVQVGRDLVNETVVPLRGGRWAWVAEWSKYAFDRTIGRPGADLYLVDLTTGERSKVREKIDDAHVEAGPAGRYVLFLDGDHFWTVDVATKTVRDITGDASPAFIDTESDQTSPAKPPFGVAGWTKDDASVLLYGKYDIWDVASDGSGARRLTDGAAEEVQHRLVRLDSSWTDRFRGGDFLKAGEPEAIDLAKPQYLSLHGEWTKKNGFARLASGRVSRLLWLDRDVRSLTKAKKAEVYGYAVQDFDVPPEVLAGGADLKDAGAVVRANPFQSEFAWGRGELIEYKSDQGRRLQGALYYPAGYEPGRKYPMIVYTYELLSQNVHNYVALSERSYYNTSVFNANGYLVLNPDIVFRPRQPGRSVVECVTAGVRKVIEMGVADPARVGIVGHSMGGFNAAYLATHTDGVFAAAVAGAPITDMVSYYGDHHWGNGIAETDHIETGQERMVVPLYEALQDYMDNSAYFNVNNMTVPLLLEAGDQDGIVAWHQSIGVYNVARRAGKNVVMLAYIGEDHGLRKQPNQKDYQRRILAWFGHYLKGDPAEAWITEGQSYLDREAEIKRETGK